MKRKQKELYYQSVKPVLTALFLWSILSACDTSNDPHSQDLVAIEDVQVLDPYCGDGVCNGGETITMCTIDCSRCGDGMCDMLENAERCPSDCSQSASTCGDGLCTAPENTQNCATDCLPTQPSTGFCGDHTCQLTESKESCSVDCGDGLAANPDRELVGQIEGLAVEQGSHFITGWACHPEWEGSIQIHVYVGGPAGQGLILKGAVANETNDELVYEKCATEEGNHRFSVPLTSSELKDHEGKAIHIYGISPVGNNNNALMDSGLHLVPAMESLPPTICGDGKCEGSENKNNCAFDCQSETTPPPPPPGAVGKWRRKVLDFSATNYSGNPFEVLLDGTFVHSQSGKSLTLPGYYDGANTWKIGFMPTETGSWTYTTSSPNSELNGHSGTLEVVESGHPGLLTADPSHPNKWRFLDGSLVIPIGVFVNAMLEDSSDQEFRAMADFVRSNNMHFLNFRISEHDLAFENVGANTMHLPRWQRLEERMEVLTERGLGVDIMFYTDDSGKPSFGAQSTQEQLLIRYAVARLCGFPTVMFNSGIDLAEYRDQNWVNWFGQTIKALDPYGHPVSSRYGGGSGNLKMSGQTYNSVGARNSEFNGLLDAFQPNDNVPASNNDNWSEDLANNINGHTTDDIRRAAWKATLAGGVAFNIRHNTLFCPAGITECDRYFHIAQLHTELNSENWLALVNPFIQEQLGDTYATMIPEPTLVDGSGGKYALADPNRNRILYFLLGLGEG